MNLLELTCLLQRIFSMQRLTKKRIKAGRWLLVVTPLFLCCALGLVSLAKDSKSIAQEKSVIVDFSYAGFEDGADLPSDYSGLKKLNVTDFGAIPNDGKDDTAAFQKALAQGGKIVVFIPQGEFEIDDILRIEASNVILKGAGKGKTILKYSRGLEDIYPAPTKNAGGTPTSKYSWSGGFIEFNGKQRSTAAMDVSKPTLQNERVLTVSKTNKKIKVGDRVYVSQSHQKGNGFLDYLYNGDPSDVSNCKPGLAITFPAIIEKLEGNKVTLDRGCRIDVRPEWQARLITMSHSVVRSGVESLTMKFPKHEYKGHFKEIGYNGIAMVKVRDCWVKDVEIVNADSGIFVKGYNCTLAGISLIAPEVKKNGKIFTGHHGFILGGSDHLLRDFNIDTTFIHGVAVTSGSNGNVTMDGNGENMSFDHHKKAPVANLFTNIDIGRGDRFLASGGGPKLGRNSAGWGVFWGIKSKNKVNIPEGFGPKTMSFVGVSVKNEDSILKKGMHLDTKTPKDLNLYKAQRERRLKKASP